MLVLLSLLQTVGEEVIYTLDTLSASGTAPSQSESFMVSLVTLLIVNVVVMVGNFIFDLIKHRKDNHNYKVHLIAEKGIEVESSAYEQFQNMASLQPGDEHQLLDSILSLDSYLNSNRLYIERKFLNHAIEFLDYFKRIQHSMRLKNVEKEESYFEKLSKTFYGE